MNVSEAIVAITFLILVGVLAVVQSWLAYRINRKLQDQNFRLLQCNLALSEKPNAVPAMLNAEQTKVEEIKSERDQALSANGALPQHDPRRARMQI